MRFGIYIVLIVSLIIVGCGAGGDYTGIEYMPDMKHSRALETYAASTVFADGKAAQLPAEGTIAKGFLPYNYENSTEDYERAGAEVKSPFNNIEHKNALANGKKLYNIYCAVCHGKGGKANGTIVENGKYPPPPSYFRDDILILPEGKMFHSVTHGKNLMGGYSSQLNQEERWEVISYIRDMQAKHIAKAQKISEDAALKQIFKGAGYTTEVKYNATVAANNKVYHDDEFDGLQSLQEGLEELRAHGGHGDGHGGGHHGEGHGDGHGHDKDHGSHGEGHDKGNESQHSDESHGTEHHNENHKEDHSNAATLTAAAATQVVEATPIKEKPADGLSEKYTSIDKVTNVTSGQVFEMKMVQFASSKSNLKGSSTPDLQKLTEILVNNPTMRIELRGHTDSLGDPDKNKALSLARAKEVSNYLTKVSKISADRIETKGFGSSQPVGSNKTPEGRKQNRRTEVKFL